MDQPRTGGPILLCAIQDSLHELTVDLGVSED
jgi:hypothetical protein